MGFIDEMAVEIDELSLRLSWLLTYSEPSGLDWLARATAASNRHSDCATALWEKLWGHKNIWSIDAIWY